uniref:Uncharacterized protein n=1 Tax=Tanacetum cinerariifolium TaxID=118510 RepID=A0A699IM24_TANCI|nr:hypothetical protein [Tanacetum cinerariifolium]
MTTPCHTPFPATTPQVGAFAPFVIISDHDDDITTLPVRPPPPSPDHIPALYGYLLDSSDDSSNENLSETTKLLHTQTASVTPCQGRNERRDEKGNHHNTLASI